MCSLISLIYVYIGPSVPDYLFDSVYQSTLVSPKNKIYIIVSPETVKDTRKLIKELNCETENITVIPTNIFDVKYPNKNFETIVSDFRDSFWINTTLRFYFIQRFMETFQIDKVVHLECDVMLYNSLSYFNNINNKVALVKDSETRVVPSIIYFPNVNLVTKLIDYIESTLKHADTFLNDMELLGGFANTFPELIETLNIYSDSQNKYIFDGAAIGQFLGGVDPRNKSESDTEIVPFFNETCTFKINPSSMKFIKRLVTTSENTQRSLQSLRLYYLYENGKLAKQVFNLHIHSKKLFPFSSGFEYEFSDIITGDRILSLVDFCFMTPEIYSYHGNAGNFINANNIFIIKDFNTVSRNKDIIRRSLNVFKDSVIKIFVYTHIVDLFIEYIYPLLDHTLKYAFYFHNSDHAFGSRPSHKVFLSNDDVHHVYAQNISCNVSRKATLLPIGIANNVFPHGNLNTLYQTMGKSYRTRKTKDLYVNINPGTFRYRQSVIDTIKQKYPNVVSQKPFEEYLQNLSEHYFCLCVRGNGIDTHRFYEALYLGVVPVIINNENTDCENFVKYLEKLELPFLKVSDPKELLKINFNKTLYKKILENSSLDALKLNYYQVGATN